MRYLGSKTLLLDNITSLVREVSENGVFCDPFGGMGAVGSAMKKLGYKVMAGDILFFAHCFQTALIENDGEASFEKIKKEIASEERGGIERYLNSLTGKDGWLVKEYAIKRKYFTKENAVQIQACLDCIREWNGRGLLQENEYKILLASLGSK